MGGAWDTGAYLAGRKASADYQFERASTYFLRVLDQTPDHPATLEGLLGAYIGAGDMLAAGDIADRMVDAEIASQAAYLTRMAMAVQSGDWPKILDDLAAKRGVSPMVDGITGAWAHYATGDVASALTALDAVGQLQGLQSAALFHKAMILALSGDAAGADAILSQAGEGALPLSLEVLTARVQLLAQLDQRAEAIALIDAYPEPSLMALRLPVEAGAPIEFDVMTDPKEAITDMFLTIADAVSRDEQYSLALLYARMAQVLAPQDAQIALLTADYLGEVDRPDLAITTIEPITADDPLRPAADQLLAQLHEQTGDIAGAIAMMRELAKARPDDPFVISALGDLLARSDDHSGAEAAYIDALAVMPQDHPGRWIVLYTRGISREQLDKWPAAEADFRAALALQPNQPSVLNYLGYSMLEYGGDPAEALTLIEQAVESEPRNGAIVDSLAWALYRLGRFEDAVAPMERAAELEPIDPIITDHWGDILWSVGRRQEAEFQWKRALSFDPEAELRARILRKLEAGLDAVLIEEGVQPVTE